MPNIIFILLMFLTLLVVLGCFYMTSSTNKKLNRLRRRYDLLLRGQTDINIEEYLLGLSGELEKFKAERSKTEQKLYHVEQWMARTDTDQSAYVNERFSTVSKGITDEMRQTTANVMQSLNRLDGEVKQRLNAAEKGSAETVKRETAALRGQLNEFSQSIVRQVRKNEEDAFVRFDSLEKDVAQQKEQTNARLTQLEGDTAQRFKQVEEGWNERLGGLQTMTQNRFQTMEQRAQEAQRAQQQEMHETLEAMDKSSQQRADGLEKDLRSKMDHLEKETDSRITLFREEAGDQMKRESSRIREQLSMAIQKIYLYRYNAFDDVAGDTSFTAVLLDEYRNGLILTTLYSRRGTTTFAKEVRTGEPVQKLSPEEEVALQEAMKR